MEPLQIEPTRTTPSVVFDPDVAKLIITGQSYPENSFEFYTSVKDWLSAYLSSQPEKLQVDFKLDYFNTSSSKCLLDLLEILENHHQQHNNIQVAWYYEEDDEDMEDSGHDFGEDLDLPFELVPYASTLDA